MAQGRKAGRAYVELGVDDKLTKGLEKAQAKLKAFGDGVKALGTGMFAVGGAATGALLAASKVFADVGSAVYDMSKRTGLSAEAVSELGYVAEQAGVEMSALEGGVRRMQKTISEAAGGSESATEAIEGLGLTLAQLAGKSPEEQFTLIAEQLSRIGDPTFRAAKAMEVFGKSGTALIPMIEGGANALAKGRKEARDFGLTISGEAAESADALGDAFGLMGKVARDVLFEVGAALAPVLTDLAGGITQVLKGVATWVSENKGLIVSGLKIAGVVTGIGAALVGVGAGIVAFGAVLGALGTIFSAVMGIASAFGAVMGVLLSPVTLVVAGVLAAGAAFLYFSGALDGAGKLASNVFAGIMEDGNTAFNGIKDALMSGDIEGAAKILWQGLRTIWKGITTELQKMWLNFVYDLAGAWEVIVSEASEVFDRITTAVASWITDLTDMLGIDSLVLGVDLTDAEREQSKAQLQSDQEKRTTQRNRDLLDKIAALEGARASEIAAADAELAAERTKLRAMAEAASLNRRNQELSDELGSLGSSVDAGDAAIPPALAKAPAALAEAMARIGSTGTFNADAAQSLQASSSPMQRVAKATERTAENTKRIAEKIESVGAYYTE